MEHQVERQVAIASFDSGMTALKQEPFCSCGYDLGVSHLSPSLMEPLNRLLVIGNVLSTSLIAFCLLLMWHLYIRHHLGDLKPCSKTLYPRAKDWRQTQLPANSLGRTWRNTISSPQSYLAGDWRTHYRVSPGLLQRCLLPFLGLLGLYQSMSPKRMRLKLTVVSHLVSTDTQNYFWHSLLMHTDMSFFQSQGGRDWTPHLGKSDRLYSSHNWGHFWRM